jgi:hypothetical protein
MPKIWQSVENRLSSINLSRLVAHVCGLGNPGLTQLQGDRTVERRWPERFGRTCSDSAYGVNTLRRWWTGFELMYSKAGSDSCGFQYAVPCHERLDNLDIITCCQVAAAAG